MKDLLGARGICKHFDGTQALREVDLSIEAGSVHALVGENGAGKSTLSKIFAGVIRPDSGEITWDGTPVSFHSPLDAQRLGIGIIFQELDLFPHLSVAENLASGNLQVDRGILVRHRLLDNFSEPLLREVGLDVSPRMLVADLSIGQMQLVAIARALGMNARLLMMDEPTSALTDDSAEKLFGLVERLKQKGVSVLYISHKMDEIFRLSDRITVLRDGAHIATKPTTETSLTEVISMMVGRELREAESRAGETSASGSVLLRARGISSPKLKDISFDLHAGEVLGIAGLVGSGRSSLGAALFGLEPLTAGRLELRGNEFVPQSVSHAIRSGIGLLPEDRKTLGLMMQMSAAENATVAVLSQLQSFGFLRFGEERRITRDVFQRLRFKGASPDVAVNTLSGGNQQKILLARWLLASPDVLILDDPTRGIDVGAKREIYDVIDELSAAGKGLILISSELPELLYCSHRILVLHEGRCMGILDKRDATQERVMALATSVLQ